MPKKNKDFPDQINFLAQAGTQEKLRAIGYMRGEGGQFAASARDFVDAGIRKYIEELSDKDKTKFNEILKNVRIMAGSL